MTAILFSKPIYSLYDLQMYAHNLLKNFIILNIQYISHFPYYYTMREGE